MEDDGEQTGTGGPADDRDQDKGLQLHWRCLEGEPTAQAQLYEMFAGQMRRILAVRLPAVQARHPDWIDDAVVDGLTDYLVNTGRYDPAKRSLLGYLVMLAAGDLLNRRDQEVRKGWEGRDDEGGNFRIVRLVDADGESVGTDLVDRNVDVEAQVIQGLLEDGDFVYVLRRSIADDDDWKVLRLLADGATKTEDYIEALGLDVPAREVARRAYDHKERVRKRARRCWEAYSDGRQVRQYNRRVPRDQKPLGSGKDGTPD